MMRLEDVRDLVATTGITEDDRCYMGKMDAKPQKAIGCYSLNRGGSSHHAIGREKTYGVYPVSILVHWNRSPRETEQAAEELYSKMDSMSEIEINQKKVQFVNMLTPHPIDVGTDEEGVYERVIEAEIYYERSNSNENRSISSV